MEITNGIGIVDGNGFPYLSYDERYKLYKECGFSSIMMWWGNDPNISREERVSLARKHGLHIANVHSDFYNMNSIWLDGQEGDIKQEELLHEIRACFKYGIDTIVMHLTNGDHPPSISKIGLSRLEDIFKLADELGVTIALENVRIAEHLIYILDKYRENTIKFCYDSGHALIWSKDVDWLDLYGQRLSAIHLHSNHGLNDDHLKFSESNFDIQALANSLLTTNYVGSLTFECIYQADQNVTNLRKFLTDVYHEGLELSNLLNQAN